MTKWTNIGGSIEACYDGSKYVDIRITPNDYKSEDKTTPDSIIVYFNEESLLKALKLFPNKGFSLGDRVVCTMPACPDCNQLEIKYEALIITVRKTIVEKLLIKKSTNKQEKWFNEERIYDIQPDDKEYIHTNCPERWLKLI